MIDMEHSYNLFHNDDDANSNARKRYACTYVCTMAVNSIMAKHNNML